MRAESLMSQGGKHIQGVKGKVKADNKADS
jgi:hypothetical protein